MQGVLDAGGGDAGAAVAALKAGCDALLYPADPITVQHAIDAELGSGVSRSRVARALGRLSAAAASAPATGLAYGRAADSAWALSVAARTIRAGRGEMNCPREFDLLTIDDDLGGPYAPPSRAPFVASLRESGFDPRPVDHLDGRRAAVVAVYADIRAWKGRPGLSAAARTALDAAQQCRPDATVLLFGHARLAPEVPGANVVVAWGGETIMQRAAARWLASETTPPSAA
jgi:hypothetical protein